MGAKYPNQQLRSVSLETFFPGRLRALGDAQEALETEFPQLFVPQVYPGEAPALRPYQFRDEACKRAVALAVNQATYISFDYPGNEAFAADAVPTLQAVLKLLAPPALNRVVYRYENEIGVQRDPDGGVSTVAKLFPGVVPEAVAGCRSLDAKHEAVWEAEGSGGAQGFHARIEIDGGIETLRVAVFASVEQVPMVEFGAAAALAHRGALELFESVISDEFRQFISGDGEE